MTDHDVVHIAQWCPACHRRLDAGSPYVRAGEEELLFRDQATGRWHHMMCLIVARRQEGGAATVRR